MHCCNYLKFIIKFKINYYIQYHEINVFHYSHITILLMRDNEIYFHYNKHSNKLIKKKNTN